MTLSYRTIKISIHAPREGSDSGNPVNIIDSVISIHAPREGSDRRPGRAGRSRRYFYPRSP